MHKLIDFICEELEELEKKASKDGKLSMAEIQYMDTLAHAKKNLLKSEEMMEGEYSMRGGSYDGSYEGRSSYDGRGSYEGSMRGNSSEGSYARGRGRNARRDSMGRYSSRGSSRRGYSMDDDFMAELNELMEDAPNDQVRQEMQQFVQRVQSKM